MKTILILIAICLIAVIGTEAAVKREKKDIASSGIGSLAEIDGGNSIDVGSEMRFKRGGVPPPEPEDTPAGGATPAPPAGGASAGASIMKVSTPILVGVAAMIAIINSFKA